MRNQNDQIHLDKYFFFQTKQEMKQRKMVIDVVQFSKMKSTTAIPNARYRNDYYYRMYRASNISDCRYRESRGLPERHAISIGLLFYVFL